MGTFDVHSDLHELDGIRGPDGLAAVGLFVLTGSWTGSHGRTGVVPHDVVQEMSAGDQDAVDRLVRAGLWERCDDGYRLLRGPHSNPDLPLPLWRYTNDDLGGRLLARDAAPDN